MSGRRGAVLLAALTVLALGSRLAPMLASAHPLGTDGYYYVVQVESLLREGSLHVPDASWVHLFLAVVAALVSDPVIGVKLGAALLAAACVPAAWAAGRQLGRGSVAAWLLAGWAAASPTLGHLAGDFPKNLGIAVPLLLLLALLASGPGRRLSGLVALVVLALVVATAHRTGAALLLLGGLGSALGWLGSRLGGGGLPPRTALLRGLVVALACLSAFALGTSLLPAWLHPADLARLQGRFALGLHWPAPWGWLGLRSTGPAEVLELSLPWLVLLAAVPAWFAHPPRRLWLAGLGLPLLVLLFPGWRVDELDMGYRLSLLAPVVAAPLAVVIGRGAFRSGASAPWWLPAACLGLSPVAWTGIDLVSAPPYERYAELIESIPQPLPELLIAHQGMSFLYDHRTGREAMAWAPEAALDRREVYRLVYGVRAGEWLAFTPPGLAAPLPVPLGQGYHYLREDRWEAFLEGALRDGDDDLRDRLGDWRNPRRVRPSHMLRGR
jgi:hypothetical protein